ncbi:MAG TPA: nitrite transporter NirC [Alphaproteobacteria bacterium]|nr:nitrite transporter NirC [Alphaproteobacteria bacterium]
MYLETIDLFADMARKKVNLLEDHPLSFYIGALMAGAYVGMGILLIFTLGGSVDPSIRPLVMGTTFGIALILVVFAGSELFTGHTMYMTLGWLRGVIGSNDLFKAWGASWLGNLAGAALLALLFAAGGGGTLFSTGADLLNTVASAKMAKSPIELFSLAILCNWLVCLALWTSARTENDAAKCILIFWCLLAFIATGFEHSVANMTVFAVALLGEHPETVSIGGMVYNLFWVTLGNTVAGALFMAIGYWAATPEALSDPSEPAKKLKVIAGGGASMALTATRKTQKLGIQLVAIIQNQRRNRKE